MNNPLDIESLDKLFKPSHWSKRYSTPEQVINKHIAFAKNGKNFDALILLYVHKQFFEIIFRYRLISNHISCIPYTYGLYECLIRIATMTVKRMTETERMRRNTKSKHILNDNVSKQIHKIQSEQKQ